MIDKRELLFVVDENNNPIEPKPREEVHSKGYWHRNSHVWILNSKNQILCQKRSIKKDTNPGRWEPFFGGHVLPGEDYLDTAVKETNEELNLDIKPQDLVHYKVVKSYVAKEFISLYKFNWDGDINKIDFDKEEIEELKLVYLPEVKRNLIRKDPNWSEFGYEKEVLDWLEN